jgi:two-component system, OmpR family, phosphate regulon sensor histidine kinase PhoR
MSIGYDASGINLPDFPKRLVNTAAGLCVAYFIFGMVGLVLRRSRTSRQSIVFGPIIDSLGKIASGDFSVRLDTTMGTHEKELYGDLVASVNKMASDLGAMEKLREEFVSDVSHEIQTPLTSIKGFAKALQSGNIGQDLREHYLAVIESECTRLSRIADNLLRLAMLESERMSLSQKPYRLDTQIRNIIIGCEPQWRAKNISLDADLDEMEITADEDLLSQVWINLTGNAIKFTPVDGTIEISLKSCDEGIEFAIKDSGIGIRPEDQPRIFERFFKSDASRQRTNEGSGLGLSIVKKIIEIVNGRITVVSEQGQGATFRVVLPITR